MEIKEFSQNFLFWIVLKNRHVKSDKTKSFSFQWGTNLIGLKIILYSISKQFSPFLFLNQFYNYIYIYIIIIYIIIYTYCTYRNWNNILVNSNSQLFTKIKFHIRVTISSFLLLLPNRLHSNYLIIKQHPRKKKKFSIHRSTWTITPIMVTPTITLLPNTSKNTNFLWCFLSSPR